MKAITKKKKKKKGKKESAKIDYNTPAFSAGSMDRNIARKKFYSNLKSAGLTGTDLSNAVDRAKLTQDSSGRYKYTTDAYSKVDPS